MNRLHNTWYRLTRKIAGLLVNLIPSSWVPKLSDFCLRSRLRLQERDRQLVSRKSTFDLSHFTNVDGQPLTFSVMENDEPWEDIIVPECQTPGMLTEAEKKYYLYISGFVSGKGSVVEVGTWLGMSTFFIANGLKRNPRFKGKLVCFDDFVWRETSMGKWVSHLEDFEKPDHLGSFHPLFQSYLELGGNTEIVESHRQKVADYYGNESLPTLEWTGEPIELAIIDCGRELGVNLGWYELLSGSFIANQTLVVMQDWQNHKRVPEIPWENTKIFTDGLGNALKLVHEVRAAGIATFLFCGKDT